MEPFNVESPLLCISLPAPAPSARCRTWQLKRLFNTFYVLRLWYYYYSVTVVSTVMYKLPYLLSYLLNNSLTYHLLRQSAAPPQHCYTLQNIFHFLIVMTWQWSQIIDDILPIICKSHWDNQQIAWNIPSGISFVDDVQEARCCTGFGCKCTGKLKIMGMASSRKRTLCPVRSKYLSSKCAEHRNEQLVGCHAFLWMLCTHCFCNCRSFGNL